jgi:predicted transcriptional regulator of viral defense system
MVKKSRISIAKDDIVRLFDDSDQKIFELSDIRNILNSNRGFWRLTKNMSCASFIDYLIKNAKLKKEIFNFSYRNIIKYTWGEVPFYELLLSLKPKSYFTHYTSMYFHGLTEQTPKAIYITHEQDPKPRSKAKLAQGRINFAFKRATRLSNNIARSREYTIRLLNGMHTGNAGVIESVGYEGEKIQLTDIERTLIDIVVRPEYSGGPFEVLKAYRLAKDKVSVNRLSALLKNINYIYPYHQVIGFYLDSSGLYSDSQINLLRKFEIKYDFYLMHRMEETDYSKKWRLHFPKGLA